MENPFDLIEHRLEVIEKKINDLLELAENPSSTKITWVNTKQLAEYLCVSTATITKLRGSRLPYYKVGGRVLFKKQEIDEVIEKTRHKTGGEYLSEYLSKNQL